MFSLDIDVLAGAFLCIVNSYRPMAAPLANFLRHGGVERLDIGDIRLGSGGCLDFHNALQEMPNLTHLNLR